MSAPENVNFSIPDHVARLVQANNISVHHSGRKYYPCNLTSTSDYQRYYECNKTAMSFQDAVLWISEQRRTDKSWKPTNPEGVLVAATWYQCLSPWIPGMKHNVVWTEK